MTFARGSRYRSQASTTVLTARGELVLGSDLRIIPPTPSVYSHRVRDRERIDLLAYKYYSDSSRWWQIADANPATLFPLDLVDRRPIVDEELALDHAGTLNATADLFAALAALGPTEPGAATLMRATVTIDYATNAARAAIFAAFAAHGFSLLSSHAWVLPGTTREAFTVEFRAGKRQWQTLVSAITALPGMLRVVPLGEFDRLSLTYNEAMLLRDGIVAEIERFGFSVSGEPARFERVGASIFVPPNRV